MNKEAMKLALEALVAMSPSGPTGSLIWHQQMYAITALREALASEAIGQLAQQEPEMNADISYIMSCSDDEFEQVTGIRLPEDAWERWSNNMDKRKNELLALFEKASQPAKYFDEVMYDGSSTAEALKRFQENVQPTQQEPVAKHYVDGGHLVYPMAQRTWVGLTDEERDDLLNNYITAEGRARAIEAKLKEKNQ